MLQLQAVNKELENNTHSACVTWLSSSGGAAATLLCLAKQLFHKHDEVEQLLWCVNECYEESISKMTLIIKYAWVSGVAVATREVMSSRSKVGLAHSANTQLSFSPPSPAPPQNKLRAVTLDWLLEGSCKGRQAGGIFAEETKHQACFQAETKAGRPQYHIAPLLSRTHTHTLTYSISPQPGSNDRCPPLGEMKN